MGRKRKTSQFKPKSDKKQQQVYKDNLALIKKLMPILVLFCIIGCSTTSDLQCDEIYVSDYNCDLPQRNVYTPFTPTYNTYRSYYPNTQTVYYVPVYVPCPTHVTPPSPEPSIEPRPRPTRTGPRPGSVTRSTGKSN